MICSRASTSFSICLLKAAKQSLFAAKMSCTEALDILPSGEKRFLDQPDSEIVNSKKSRPDYQRIKRRKYVMLICYSGQGYFGLQRNPGMKTIEEDLLLAWLKAGVINDEIFSNPRQIDFQRAARTDKGVSAVRQTISAKMPMDVDVNLVNKHLPEQIRMIAIKRTTKGFNCQGNADARTYSYTMPSFALAPHDQFDEDYRITTDVLDRTNSVLNIYRGTHNYHNFTSKKSFLDPSANRYIMSINCEEPTVLDGLEFVTIYVKGQSFMLHQIRKMIGLAVAIVRGLADESVLLKAWKEEKLDIPIAPGLGLVLEEVHYDRYNTRYTKDGMHDAIEWSNEKTILDEFKLKFISSTIIKTEKTEKSMQSWLQTLPMHTFDVRNVHRQNVVDENGQTREEEESDEKTKETANLKEA